MTDFKKLFVFLILFCVIVVNLAAFIKPYKRRSQDEDLAEVLQIDYECANNNINRTECQNIMSNSILVASRMRLNQTAPESLRDSVDKKTKCPDFRHGHLLTPHLPRGERSLSPYDNIIDYDPIRIPRYISQAKCLCEGCINPKTLKETKMLESVELKVKVNVLKRNKNNVFVQEMVNISVGCTCIIRKQIQINS